MTSKGPQIFFGGDSGDIVFLNETELIRICDNGDVYVQGNLLMNSPDFVAAFKAWYTVDSDESSSGEENG